MATFAPPVSSLPPAPAVSDSKAVFNAKAYPFVDSLTQMADEMNAVSDWINANLNMVGPSTFNQITVDAPTGLAEVILKQAGVIRGKLMANSAAVIIDTVAGLDTAFQVGGVVSQRFGANGNAGFGGFVPDTSARIQSANGIKLGNTANTNPLVLDWYEEGTFTPSTIGSVTGGAVTYGIRYGAYTRIGNCVYFDIHVGWVANTGTGGIILAGLPFVTGPSTGTVPAVFFDGLVVGAGKQVTAAVPASNTTVNMIMCDLAGGGLALIPIDTNVPEIRTTGYYFI